MWKILGWINKNLTISIPILMISGFTYGISLNPTNLKDLIIPFTFLMVYPMMVNLKINKVFNLEGQKVQFITQFINFGIIPFIALFLGQIFFSDKQYLVLGLLLASLLPTSGMTISWTGFAKGNLEAAVKMTVIGLTLGSIAAPFYIKWLMGAQINIDINAIFIQILVIIFIPMVLGYTTQNFLIKKVGQIKFKDSIAPKFSSLSTVGVLGIVFIAIALKAETIALNPAYLLYLLIPIIILYGINFILSTFVGKIFLPKGDAIALVYGTVMRNLSIALAIAINAFGEHGTEIALIISAAYIVQVQSAAWYVKFTDRIFKGT